MYVFYYDYQISSISVRHRLWFDDTLGNTFLVIFLCHLSVLFLCHIFSSLSLSVSLSVFLCFFSLSLSLSLCLSLSLSLSLSPLSLFFPSYCLSMDTFHCCYCILYNFSFLDIYFSVLVKFHRTVYKSLLAFYQQISNLCIYLLLKTESWNYFKKEKSSQI